MDKTIGNTRIIVLTVVAMGAALFQLGTSGLISPEAQAKGGYNRSTLFTAARGFGLAQGQMARFCVGTRSPRGASLDWTVSVTDERGGRLVQLPETRSPAGERRCVNVPRSALRVAGKPSTGQVRLAARQIVKAPIGTRSSDIIGSFEIVNADGTTGGFAGVLYAAFHNND